MHYATVKIEFVDRDNNIIDTNFTNINGIGADRAWKWKVFTPDDALGGFKIQAEGW